MKDNSEPAFPVTHHMNEDGTVYQSGMTLRQYYAAHCPDLGAIHVKADQERLTGLPQPDPDDSFGKILYNAKIEAALRFIYADAMIEAGKK